MRTLKKSLVVLLVFALGCADSDMGEGVGDGDGASWTLEGPQVRIGSVDQPEYAFGGVTSLALAPDGSLYSMHFGEFSIRHWSSDGEVAGLVGRQGEGPGEFTGPGSMGFFGDTLWVMDRRAFRVNYFAPDGTFLGSVTPRVDIGSAEEGFRAPPRPSVPLRDGTFYGEAPGFSQEIATGELTETATVHMSRDGTVLAPVWSHPWESHDVLALLRKDGQGGSFGRQPFTDAVLSQMRGGVLTVIDRRVWDGDGPATVGITKIGLDGDTLLSRRIAYTPEPLPRERVDSAAAAMTEGMFRFLSRGQPDLKQDALERDIREAMFGPAFLPPVTSMLVTEEGDLWLARPGTGPDGVAWWVFDGEARHKGTVHVPEGLQPRVMGGGVVWGVETDDLGVNYIVRYGVVEGG
jgi:hypothetical protein